MNNRIYIYTEEQLNNFINKNCHIPSLDDMQLFDKYGRFMRFKHRITIFDILDYNNYEYVLYEDNGAYWLEIKLEHEYE